MEEVGHKFRRLREELVAAVMQSPAELNLESVQRLVEMPLPSAQKYQAIDARGIIRANTQGQVRGLRVCVGTMGNELPLGDKLQIWKWWGWPVSLAFSSYHRCPAADYTDSLYVHLGKRFP